MNKPTDYPVQADKNKASDDTSSADITYAVLRDRVAAKKPVTDEMIRIARTKLETAHASNKDQSKFTLSRIRDRFKQS